MIERIITFFRTQLWNYQLTNLPKWQSWGLKSLRILTLSLRDFFQDRCILHASALTYYTLLTIVPVLALAFGVAQGFGLEGILEKQLYASFAGQEDAIAQILKFVNETLERTRGEVIAGIGIIILLWSVVRILSNVENALNKIWHVKKSRTWLRKLTDYIALTIFAPILMALSGSMNVYISTTLKRIANDVEFISATDPIIDTPLKLLPYIIIWLLLTFLYIVLPNRPVKFKPAFIGGILAGTLYIFVQWGYINFQVGVSNFNAIYGSFAALPLFLIWVQLSWMLVLFGAEVSFAVQNVHRYEQYEQILNISNRHRKLLALVIAQCAIKRFENAQSPYNVTDFSEYLGISEDLVYEIIQELEKAKILSPVASEKNEQQYQPALDINKLSIHFILSKLDFEGNNNLKLDNTVVFDKLNTHLGAMELIWKNTDENILLKDLS